MSDGASPSPEGEERAGGAPLVAVLDYGIGNLRSAQKALQRVGADARLTADPELIGAADAVVLPGVGNVGRCMEALVATGLDHQAREAAASGRPFMGICVGMQLLYERSEESPDAPLLGILEGQVRRLPAGVKHPQMQWNVLERTDRPSQLLEGIDDPVWVYFVHTYAAEETGLTVATCEYGGTVVAAVESDGVWATQFHPEKSGETGMAILERFVRRAGATAPTPAQ